MMYHNCSWLNTAPKVQVIILFLQYSDDTPVSGSTLFGFHTPRRRGALAEAGKLLNVGVQKKRRKEKIGLFSKTLARSR